MVEGPRNSDDCRANAGVSVASTRRSGGEDEGNSNVRDLAKTTREAESLVQEWLAVLARCFQLQDAISLVELDRVLDMSPDDLDWHRMALKAARQKRLELIARNTEPLIVRMDAAAGIANTKVLLNPNFSRAVVHSSSHVAGSVAAFAGGSVSRKVESLWRRGAGWWLSQTRRTMSLKLGSG